MCGCNGPGGKLMEGDQLKHDKSVLAPNLQLCASQLADSTNGALANA